MNPESIIDMNRERSPVAEQRVSTLVGDRLCIDCGYNLTGQPILREPHYHMLIVRCPECGTVASVQEYPLLGRWANRWAVLLAGLWLLVLIALLIGTSTTLFGFSVGTAEDACNRFDQKLYQLYETHRQKQIAASGNPQVGWTQNDMMQWRDQQDFHALFVESGGWRGAVNWQSLAIWLPYSLIAFAAGCVWAVMLLMQRWRGRAALWLLVVVIAAAMAYFFAILQWVQNPAYWYWSASRRIIGPPILGVSLLLGAVVLALGMLLGRRVARGLIRLLLPPRLRSALAMLWIVDGLALPKTRG